MASAVAEERLNKIKTLNCFINSVEERVKAITEELDWNYEELGRNKESSLVTCSIRPEHRIRESYLKEHEEKCRWAKDGYHVEDVAFPEHFGHGSSLVLTSELMNAIIRNTCSGGSSLRGNYMLRPSKLSCHYARVSESEVFSSEYWKGASLDSHRMKYDICEAPIRDVPQTSAKFDQDFTRNEKLAIYDYVIANTEGTKLYPDIAASVQKEAEPEKKVMTPLEIAAAKRDAKRRRASYRNKVHTNRKTQTEILREVIESQMEVLKEEVSYKNVEDPKEKHFHYEPNYNDKGRSRWKHERDAGYSSGRSHKSHKYKDHRNHHHHSSRDSESAHERDSRKSKHKKSKKHKRSHSKSRSQEKSKYKESYT